MEKHKEVFFVVRLHSSQSAASLPSVSDPDTLINCDLMDGRDAFLTLARDKHYEFSSLRRTKFSSLAMLYELHNSSNDRFLYTCNNCKRQLIDSRYHCGTCDDFDLCVNCYQRDGHNHHMDRIDFGDMLGGMGGDDSGVSVSGSSAVGGDLESGDAATPGNMATSPSESRRLSIQRCIQSLYHACQCRDANCRRPSCIKMKRVVQHAKACKRKNAAMQGGAANGHSPCPICKQLIALCCYHAKHCEEPKCPVPYCMNIKQKLNHQRLQHRIAQQALVKRRMASMMSLSIANAAANNARDAAAAAAAAAASSSSTSTPFSPQQVRLPHKSV